MRAPAPGRWRPAARVHPTRSVLTPPGCCISPLSILSPFFSLLSSLFSLLSSLFSPLSSLLAPRSSLLSSPLVSSSPLLSSLLLSFSPLSSSLSSAACTPERMHKAKTFQGALKARWRYELDEFIRPAVERLVTCGTKEMIMQVALDSGCIISLVPLSRPRWCQSALRWCEVVSIGRSSRTQGARKRSDRGRVCSRLAASVCPGAAHSSWSLLRLAALAAIDAAGLMAALWQAYWLPPRLARRPHTACARVGGAVGGAGHQTVRAGAGDAGRAQGGLADQGQGAGPADAPAPGDPGKDLCLAFPLPSRLRHCLCRVCSTAFAAKTLPLPCVPTAFVVKTLPCVPTASVNPVPSRLTQRLCLRGPQELEQLRMMGEVGCGTPTTRTATRHDGPNHLGLCCDALHEHQTARITSDLWRPRRFYINPHLTDAMPLHDAASRIAAGMRGMWARLAPDETVILLHPPLPLVGVSIVMEREGQQIDSLVNG